MNIPEEIMTKNESILNDYISASIKINRKKKKIKIKDILDKLNINYVTYSLGNSGDFASIGI